MLCHLDLVFLAGHVDAGKSTLMGHVLVQLGCVNKKTIHKYEQESKKIGKASFAYAWVLDETEEERYVSTEKTNLLLCVIFLCITYYPYEMCHP